MSATSSTVVEEIPICYELCEQVLVEAEPCTETTWQPTPTSQALEEEEEAWLPNPYQEQADAQVAAGAWPGMPLLFGAQQFGGLIPQPCNGQDTSATPACFVMVPIEATGAEQQDCSGGTMESHCWAAEQPWGFFYPVKENEALANSSTVDSTDEGEAASDSQEESEKSGNEEPAQEGEGDADGKYIRKLSHANVPKNTDMAAFADKVENDQVTTLMVRNIPNMYTRNMLVEELDSLGFEKDYDFIYLPIDKSTQWNVGYAFVNFKTPEAAKRCVTDVTDYTFNRFEHGSRKVAQISVAHIQGLERNLEYYSKTAVQCARVNAHRPHFVPDKRQDSEVGGRSHRKQRRSGFGSGRGSRHSSSGYPPCSADVYLQESGPWHRGSNKWH